VTNPSPERAARKDVIGDEEFATMMDKADKLTPMIHRLRTRALLCMLRLTGKRRGEIANLSLYDFRSTENMLNVTFTLEKKRKGSVMKRSVVKGLPLDDPLTGPIIEYLNLLQQLDPIPLYFMVRTFNLFGNGWGFDPDNHLGGRQVLNLLRQVSDMAWPHLFRETVGAEIIKGDPTIIGIFKVKQRLDHEDLKTSMGYLQRYATDVIRREGLEL
jgi:integrase